MMGKIEEVYRLPLLPMRRDMRSKLQKIATEVGLVAKPAAPHAEAADFFVYENWLAGPHKIVLHRSTCGQCNHGKGRPAGHDANHARVAWSLCDAGAKRGRSPTTCQEC